VSGQAACPDRIFGRCGPDGLLFERSEVRSEEGIENYGDYLKAQVKLNEIEDGGEKRLVTCSYCNVLFEWMEMVSFREFSCYNCGASVFDRSGPYGAEG